MPTMETSGTSFLTITNATGNPGSAALPQFSEITFDNATTSDATNATNALLELNSAGTNLSGVYVLNGYAGNGGQGSAVKIDAGAIQNCHVFGGALAVVSVIDGNGMPIGGCSVQSSNGFDYVVNTSNVDRLRSDLFTAGDTNGPAFFGRLLRGAASLRWPSILRWATCSTPGTHLGSELRWCRIQRGRSMWSLQTYMRPRP